MPTDSTLYQRDWAGYTNAFLATGWGLGYTMRASYRGWSFGIRIDHILSDGHWYPLTRTSHRVEGFGTFLVLGVS